MARRESVAAGVVSCFAKLFSCLLLIAGLGLGGYLYADFERGAKSTYVSTHVGPPSPHEVCGNDRAMMKEMMATIWERTPLVYGGVGAAAGIMISILIMVYRNDKPAY